MTESCSSWRAAFSLYTQPRVLSMILLGFSAGLPFSLVSTTLSAWLADEHVTLSVIGYFSLVGIAYSLKVFWAPVVDGVSLPFLHRRLGKRRSWMLLAQSAITLGLLGISTLAINQNLHLVALLAICVAFSSATQDIVIDAYRIEAAVAEFQGAMAAMYVFGYRLALLVAGAGALYIADYGSWKLAYRFMSLAMLFGILTTLLISEPEHIDNPETEMIEGRVESALGVGNANPLVASFLKWFSDAVISPFIEFFQRGAKNAIWILMLIAVYKISDMAMGVVTMPFYLDMGFSKKDIAGITKVFGFFMTIIGSALGGVFVFRFGILRTLLLGAVSAALTNLLFAGLASTQPSLFLLAGVISADNLSGGIASAALIAYLSSLTNTAYTATQYALFSSLMTLPAKLIGSLSGEVAGKFGYEVFFVYSAIIGLPAIILVMILAKNEKVTES